MSEPWVEVIDRLWIGNTELMPRPERFDAVVTIGFQRASVAEGVRHQHYTECQAYPDAGRLTQLAAWAAERWNAGDRVLIRSTGGQNRSGMCTARTLTVLGAKPYEAMQLVRSRRPRAISAEYLRRMAEAVAA